MYRENIRPLVYSYPDEYATAGLGSDGRGSIISASSYEHSSLSASESQLYWVTSERFCVHKDTVCCIKGLLTGFFDAHYIMNLYLNQYICMYTVYELYNYFLKDQSEFICSLIEIYFESYKGDFVLHFEVYIYTVK